MRFLNEIVHVKCLAQCLACSKGSVDTHSDDDNGDKYRLTARRNRSRDVRMREVPFCFSL